jgi:ribosome-associated translation inhibitor RaiA
MSVRITGDLLALDQRIKQLVNQQSQGILDSFPGRGYQIQARINEEFDQLHGHRVRFELVVSTPGRQQVMIREARKKADEAIKAAFAGLKGKLRRLGTRRPNAPPSSSPVPAAGA